MVATVNIGVLSDFTVSLKSKLAANEIDVSTLC